MIAIVSLLSVITISILITRVATIALIHTGLSRAAARFQARSALTGVGYTTSESERIVNHPVRRRIVLSLMLIGNAGIVTAMSSLILTFVGEQNQPTTMKVFLLVAGIILLWVAAQSRWVDRRLSRLIDVALRRWTDLDVRDYASLMHLAGDYRLVELQVSEEDWIANRSLAELELRDEGVVVLAIQRKKGEFLGAPTGDTRIHPEDVLIVYGRGAAVVELDERRRGIGGDVEHEQAVAEQEEVLEMEERLDREGESESGEVSQTPLAP